MKRDLDRIREILVMVENAEGFVDFQTPHDAHQVAIMHDAGLLQAQLYMDDNRGLVGAMVVRLTWLGHDFVSVSRNPSVWSKTKEKVQNAGWTWTLDLLMKVMERLASQALGL